MLRSPRGRCALRFDRCADAAELQVGHHLAAAGSNSSGQPATPAPSERRGLPRRPSPPPRPSRASLRFRHGALLDPWAVGQHGPEPSFPAPVTAPLEDRGRAWVTFGSFSAAGAPFSEPLLGGGQHVLQVVVDLGHTGLAQRRPVRGRGASSERDESAMHSGRDRYTQGPISSRRCEGGPPAAGLAGSARKPLPCEGDPLHGPDQKKFKASDRPARRPNAETKAIHQPPPATRVSRPAASSLPQ